MHRSLLWACAILVALSASPIETATAAPVDAKVGETRAVFKRAGTPLRDDKSVRAGVVVVLPKETSVVVRRVQLPWLQVTATVQGKGNVSGWLRAFETVLPSALKRSGAPAHRTTPRRGGTSSRDVTAAGRQLDASTERGYRASRAELAQAYAAVDAMEDATASLDPAEAIEFILEGSLGRRGLDYARPARVPAGKGGASSGGSRRGSGLAGKIGGEVVKRLGGSRRAGEAAGAALSGAAQMAQQLNERFTPGQEYYLGRAVAAQAIAKYGVDKDAARRRYVRMVGEAIVRTNSRLPANHGGYHFEVLDSDEINGVSGPGGFVLVTRGAVQACRSEAELASVLCHELAHCSKKHGEATIRKGKRFGGMIKTLASTGAAAAGANDVKFAAGLVQFFGEAAGEMARTSIEQGYGRNLEFAADAEGTFLLWDVYYDHTALRSYLTQLGTLNRGHGHAGTHASPQVRAGALSAAIAQRRPFTFDDATRSARQARFDAAIRR